MAHLDLETRRPDVAIVRFVNPPTGLLTAAMATALELLVRRLAEDPDVRIVIFTGGQPDVFVRHFDVGELAAAAQAVRGTPAPEDAEWHSSLFHRITRALETLPKPVIAAINGVCMGVGYELALACDIRIASRGDYPIGLPEVNIGVCPGGGGTVRLTRLVGRARALEMLYAGQTFPPERAAELGLVNRVAADALQEAERFARELSAKSSAALAAIKRVCGAAADLGIEPALTVEQRVVNERMRSEEMGELMRQMNDRGLDIREVGPESRERS